MTFILIKAVLNLGLYTKHIKGNVREFFYQLAEIRPLKGGGVH